MLFLMMLLVNNFHYCTFKSSVHEKNIREKIQLCKPIANFVSYQKGEFYASVKIFNALPAPISNQVMNKNCFTKNLKTSLIVKPLYSSEEYFNLCKWDED